MDRFNRSQESVVLRANGETCSFNPGFNSRSGLSSRFKSLFVGVLPCALAALAIGTSGCAVSQSLDSFSDSSGSISDSLGSFSDSSESSSGSSGDETAYRNDVRDYTVAYLRAHAGTDPGTKGSPEALRLGISEVALARGITNWEALPSTFLAVGEGFAEAGLTLAEAEPYRNALAPPDSASAQSMIEGQSRVRIPSVASDASSPDDDL